MQGMLKDIKTTPYYNVTTALKKIGYKPAILISSGLAAIQMNSILLPGTIKSVFYLNFAANYGKRSKQFP